VHGHCFVACDRSEDDQRHSVVLVHQSQWQQRMLELYGTDMCLLDATYNTTWYGMPLYFLCVASNVGYINVATMLLADDTAETIADGLRTVAQWNPQWSPKFVMSDFSLAQISATETVFPGIKILRNAICTVIHMWCRHFTSKVL